MLGKQLLQWLYGQDRTPGFLCRTAGVDPDDLIDLIVGAAAPGEDTLARLAEATELPLDQLQQAAADQAVSECGPDPLRCYKVNEVAARMGVSPDTVRSEMDSGALGYIIVGQRARRIPHQALDERLGRWRDPDRGQGHGR